MQDQQTSPEGFQPSPVIGFMLNVFAGTPVPVLEQCPVSASHQWDTEDDNDD